MLLQAFVMPLKVIFVAKPKMLCLNINAGNQQPIGKNKQPTLNVNNVGNVRCEMFMAVTRN
jgi:hypothetical protein